MTAAAQNAFGEALDPQEPAGTEPGKLQALIALAHEPSSERRRDLMREVADLFCAAPESRSPREQALFDDVLTRLNQDLESEVQAELSRRMAPRPDAPPRLIRTLASGAIEAATPVLTQSTVLTSEEMAHIAASQGQAHLKAVSNRRDLSAAAVDVIVERGDDDTLKSVLANPTADLSRRSCEAAVDRAALNPDLHAAVVGRRELPVDLLNEMYFVVEARLRREITARNQEIDPEALEAALAAGRTKLATKDGALPSDYGHALKDIRERLQAGRLTPAAIVKFLREGERTRFIVAMSEAAELDFHTVRRIVERRDLDALAIVCKAANFEKALFLTFAVLILEGGHGFSRADVYTKLYADLPREAALRTLRFWRVRRLADQAAA
jgi:uncharacterized protein (DUF2336 family)